MGFSTREAAKKLGIGEPALYSFLRRQVIRPPVRLPGGNTLIWTEADVAAAREALQGRRQPFTPPAG